MGLAPALHEQIEHAGKHVAGNASTIVADGQRQLPRVAMFLDAPTDADVAAGFRKLGRIVQEVRDDLHESRGVDVEHAGPWNLD
jgi:hypothetical protein